MTLTPMERDELFSVIQRRVANVLVSGTAPVPTAGIANGAVTRAKIDGVALMPQDGAYVVGQHYALMSQPSAFTLSATAKVANATTLYPWTSPRTWTPAALGFYVTTSAPGSTSKVLVYTHDTTTRWPTTLAYSSEALATATDNTLVTDTTGLPTFTAGTTYWLGIISDGTPTMRSQTVVADALLGHLATAAATTASTHLLRTGETFATPTTPWAFAASQLATGNIPIVIAIA